MITTDMEDNYKYVEELREWLAATVPAAACRVMYQDTLGNSRNRIFSASHIFVGFSAETGIQSIGAWSAGTLMPNESQISTESGRFMGAKVGDLSNRDILNYMQEYNIRYIVCCGEELFYKLDRTGMFEIAFDNPEFIVFELKPELYAPSWTRTVSATDLSFAPLGHALPPRMDWIVQNPDPAAPITLKFQYHPFWKADWNSNPVPLVRTATGNMEVVPPEKSANAQLSLIYDFHPWPPFLVSMAGCAAMTGFCLLPGLGRKKRRGPTPPAATSDGEPRSA